MQGEVEATAGAPPVAQERPRAFGALWPFLRYAFIASIVSEVLYGLSCAHAYIVLKNIYDGADVSEASAGLVDLHQGLTSILYFIVMVVAIVAYCRFFYRAMKNLTAVNAAGLRTTPFWAVGYFFVPIVNLWKPLGAVRQIWRGSFDPKAADVHVPSMIGWWWFCWLVQNFLGNISFRMQMKSGGFGEEIVDFDAYLGSLTADMISAPFAIAGAMFVLQFSARIKLAQDENVL